MTNEEVQKKLQWISERVLRAMHIKCESSLRRVWSTTYNAPMPREAFFNEWGFKFAYDNSHCITITNLAALDGADRLVFHYNFDTHEFFWKPEIVEEYVEEILNRIMVLDRMAEI